MSNKEKYIRFADSQDKLPLFLQPWWLEAAMAGEGDWDAALIEEESKVRSALPYCFKKRLGITNLFIPWCTPYLAAHPADTPHLPELLGQLPQAADYRFRQFPGLTAEAWQTEGYAITNTVTHILDAPDTDTYTKQRSDATRRNIRTAERAVTVTSTEDLDIAYRLWADTMDRKKAMKALVPEKVMISIDEALKQRGQRQILLARDPDGRVHAAVYIAMDTQYSYYLWGAFDPAFKSSKAMALLMDHAIRQAINSGRKFDFEGSRVEGISRFYRGFGAKPVSVYSLHKTPSLIGKIIKRGK